MDINKINFQYLCKYDYKEYYACQYGSNCCDNDYCRCGVIENAKIVEAPSIESMINKIWPKEKNILLRYGYDRLLRLHKAYDPELYHISICGGYYGEEVNGVYFVDRNLDKDVVIFNGLTTDQERIEFLLLREYGFVLDAAKNRNWEIIKIKADQIKLNNENYCRKVGSCDFYENYELPKAVCLKDDYRVIDGYHRMAANKSKTITIICGA